MTRLSTLATLLASTAALATGERVSLTPASNPLKATLCVSMECGVDTPDATVSSRPSRGGLEITVTMSSGQRRLTYLLPANADGTVSSTDLVRATSLVVRAIEEGPMKKSRPEPARAQKPAKNARPKLLAHR